MSIERKTESQCCVNDGQVNVWTNNGQLHLEPDHGWHTQAAWTKITRWILVPSLGIPVVCSNYDIIVSKQFNTPKAVLEDEVPNP